MGAGRSTRNASPVSEMDTPHSLTPPDSTGAGTARPHRMRIRGLTGPAGSRTARGGLKLPGGPRAGALLALAALAVPLSGCGESQQEKSEKAALKTVCTARNDIKTRLATIKTLTPSAVSLPQLKTEGEAIFEDLKKIQQAQPDLEPARKQKVQQATQTFQHEVSAVLSSVSSLTPSTLSSAGPQLQSALSRLQTSYTQALAPIECST